VAKPILNSQKKDGVSGEFIPLTFHPHSEPSISPQ
jgi:hypothetical protein